MITKRDIEKEGSKVNHWYMMKGMNRYISIIYTSRSYSKYIIEINGYFKDHKILERRFTRYLEAWYYLIGIQDGLDVL